MKPIDNDEFENLKYKVIDNLVENFCKTTIDSINLLENHTIRNRVFSMHINRMLFIFLSHCFESEYIKNDEIEKISLAQDFINAALIEFNFQCKIEKVNNE